jgi:hypothetical protein
MAPTNKSSAEVRRRLAEQKKAKDAAVRNRTNTRQALANSGRALPPKGGSGAGSPRATAQRTATAVNTRVQNDTRILQGLADNMRRNQARDARASGNGSNTRMSRGGTRYVPPGGANSKGKPALPPGNKGGALATRGGPLATRPSTAVTPPKGGALSPRGRGGGTTNGRIQPVRVSEVPKPQLGGSGGARGSLPGGRPGGALAGAGRAIGQAVKGAGRPAPNLRPLGGGAAPGLFGRVALPAAILSQAADVVGQARNTKEAWNRMVGTKPADIRGGGGNTGRRNANDPYGAGSRLQWGGPMADIRGTGRPVPPDPRPKPKPKPDPKTDNGGGGSRGAGGGSRGVGGGSVGRPSVTSSVSKGSASKAPESAPATKSKADSSTDSWSINFLRSKRGLPSLSKGAAAKTPSSDSTAGPLSGNFGKDIGYERRLSIPSSGENGYGKAKLSDQKFDPKSDLLKRKDKK